MFRLVTKDLYQLEFQYIGCEPSWPHHFNANTKRWVCGSVFRGLQKMTNVADKYEAEYKSIDESFTIAWYFVPLEDCGTRLYVSRTGNDRILACDYFYFSGFRPGEKGRFVLPMLSTSKSGLYYSLLHPPTAEFKAALRKLYQPDDFPLLPECREQVFAALRAMPGEVILPDLDAQ